MHNREMDIRRLEILLELSRLGSMARVAEHLNTTTSTVSQQIAKLGVEAGTALVEPAGRRVRLTPAGRRLADHAAVILGAVEAARVDLDPAADPAGTFRVSGFATAIRRTLLPVVKELTVSHPDVEVRIYEHEPAEALALLATDDIDLALTYDYTLAPAGTDPTVETTRLWSRPWSLGSACRYCSEQAGRHPVGLRRVRRQALDRQLAQLRRRGGGPVARGDGWLRASGGAPVRQPRAGPGPHRRGIRRRYAAVGLRRS